MANLEELVRKRDQLNARIKAEQARQRASERKARNHALMVLGGMIERECGGDWRAIDYRRLDALLYRSRKSLAQAKLDEARETKDATRSLREFEKWKRDRASDRKGESTQQAAERLHSAD